MKEYSWERRYKTQDDPSFIIEKFLRPAIHNSNTMFRGVGYFSSSTFDAIGETLGDFVSRGGTIWLITNVEYSETDKLAVENGLKNWGSIAEDKLSEIIQQDFLGPMSKGSVILTRLLEMGRLKMKIALRDNGIYHEKSGVFFEKSFDESLGFEKFIQHLRNSNFLSYGGSMNDSQTAQKRNYEKIWVWPSWDEKRKDDADDALDDFVSLWNNEDTAAEVVSFSEAAKRELIRIKNETESNSKFISNSGDDSEEILGDPRWVHQDEAVELFLAPRDPDKTSSPMPAGGEGVLQMATGTGKTWTAFKIIRRLLAEGKIDKVIVETFGSSLLDQWYDEILENLDAIQSIHRNYTDSEHKSWNEGEEFLYVGPNSCLLTSTGKFPDFMKMATDEQLSRTLLIADECHRIRTPGHMEALTGQYHRIPYRLGLSATPESEYNQDANSFLFEEIGEVFFEFGLEDAILRGILCPFEYVRIHYTPSDEDKSRVHKTLKRYKKLIKKGKATEAEMRREISRIYKISEEKIAPFRETVSADLSLLDRSMIFGLTKEFCELIQRIVLQPLDIKFHTYFAEDDKRDLMRFARGELNCLITCQRLSEGIDVKDCSSIVLMYSDRAKLQTIQRIGRALRTDPSNPKKKAVVIDLIGDEVSADNERESWLIGLSEIRPEGWDEI